MVKKDLSTAGRITVVKTLLIPKFSLLLITLTSPLRYHEFCTKFDLKTPFTLFLGVINCIRKIHLNYDYDNIQRSQPFFPKFLQLITKSKQGGRDFYDVFISQKYKKKPKSESKWENILDLNVDDSLWKKQNILFFKITNDIQLKWFNYRIVHRILATNTFLCKYKFM